MSAICFEAKLYVPGSTAEIGSYLVLTLPKDESAKLPAQGGHWFKIGKIMCEAAGVDIDDTVTLEIEPAKVWLEPEMPADLKRSPGCRPARARQMDGYYNDGALGLDPLVGVGKTNRNAQGAAGKLCLMLRAGKRRPCCFNRTISMPPRSAEAL